MKRVSLLTFTLVAALASSAVAQQRTAHNAAMSPAEPNPDPRVGLKAGLFDAGTALWNLQLVSTTKPSEKFMGITNSDLAFSGKYVIQGSYDGYQVWDVSDPKAPKLTTTFFCPASQSDVSVYKNLLFVSGEGLSGRTDCGSQGVPDTVSAVRLRGIRVIDATDMTNPKYLTNVQTCRGSHTHTVVNDPKDPNNVYIYVSGSAPVRSPSELPGCSALDPSKDPNSALFRIEVIKVPLAAPQSAAIVSSPRIFDNLAAPKSHGAAPEDIAESAKRAEEAKAKGRYVVKIQDEAIVVPDRFVNERLDSIVKARGATGAPTAADSATLRDALQGMVDKMVSSQMNNSKGPSQCHDITVYPAVGLAGGACGGYGLLLDISDVANPRRLSAVADSNFSYWHSATFSNDGSKILFTDEWGGGGAPRCRATDKREWGADAIFTRKDTTLTFQSYYKLPAPQTTLENCVAHNGSLIPIPGREVMVQGWYQGGISVFDWTNPAQPQEIAFFDRGPADSTKMAMGGSWSAYWYNGHIYSSEIARGLDVLDLTPSPLLSQNEIDAAKTVQFDYYNVQDQQKFVWPATFSLARAYLDQLEREKGFATARIAAARSDLSKAEKAAGAQRHNTLVALGKRLHSEANGAREAAKVHTLAGAVDALAAAN